ncbi:MAG: hypothetical protein JWM32_1718 [Verrucomicrobia bacterium]|nr:hypothetical protein [Verrucomicrobiota bacterium]
MSKKINRGLYGPSWTEAILGALLSVILGLVLAVTYLVFKPVTMVKEIPKEPAKDMIYYIEGSHDANKARRLAVKQKALFQGGTVGFTEDELNAAMIVNKPPGVEVVPTDLFTPGAPNFRFQAGNVQIATPIRIKYALVGLDTNVLVTSTGSIVKEGTVFVYVPTTLYVGSCPVHSMPLLFKFLTKRIADEMASNQSEPMKGWRKMSEITIDGSTLRLTAPKPS